MKHDFPPLLHPNKLERAAFPKSTEETAVLPSYLKARKLRVPVHVLKFRKFRRFPQPGLVCRTLPPTPVFVRKARRAHFARSAFLFTEKKLFKKRKGFGVLAL